MSGGGGGGGGCGGWGSMLVVGALSFTPPLRQVQVFYIIYK